MKINLQQRRIKEDYYYVTEKEARILCQLSNPKGMLPPLPADGNERRVVYENKVYWLGRIPADGSLVWAIYPEESDENCNENPRSDRHVDQRDSAIR